jgi:hypothetical protein
MIAQALFTLLIVTTGMLIWLAISDYKLIHKRHINPFNEFPYEWFKIHQETGKYNFYRGLLIAILLMFFALMIAIYQVQLGNLFFFFVVVLTFVVASTYFIFFLDPRRIEIFIYLNVIYLVSPLVLFAWLSYGHYASLLMMMPSWSSFVTLGLTLIQILIVFNPRFKQWSQLEKAGSNEKPLYRRPERFVLAYSQWLTLLNLVVLVIVSYIASLI